MMVKRAIELLLVLARVALAAGVIYLAWRYMPAFFAMWDTKQPIQWWAGRATGFAAYAALALSMVFGLMVSSRGLDGAVNRKTVTDYHQQWALMALVFTVVHMLVIVTDKYVDISVTGSLVPGRSAHMTGAVALGTFAFWGMAIVIVSSWARSLLSYDAWRAIHSSATAVTLVALAHGFIAGTDSKQDLVRAIYLGSGAIVFGMTVFRLAYEFRKPRDAGARTSSAAPRPAAAPPPAGGAATTEAPRTLVPRDQRTAPPPSNDGAIVLDLVAAARERRNREDDALPRAHGRPR